MKLVTAKDMQRLDRKTIEEYGIPGLTLMENAGEGIVRMICERYGNPSGKIVTVVAGKGNNGGDGLVVARHLARRGSTVRVFLLSRKEDLKGDARTNLDRYCALGGAVHEQTSGTLPAFTESLKTSDLIVDALFGTGQKGPVQGTSAEVISIINSTGKPVVAVDLPSGVNPDTGGIAGVAIKAHLTVTFFPPKRGLFMYPAASCVGELKMVDIGIPHALVEAEAPAASLLTEDEVKELLPRRSPDSHKGTFGHLLVIAGSLRMSGAAALTSLSALRAGAGLVTLALPAHLAGTRPGLPPEVMTEPLPHTDEGTVGRKAGDVLRKIAVDKDVVAIGPGLSTHPETQEIIREVLMWCEKPLVVDADGINALVGHLGLLEKRRSPVILTPHPGEMARLMGATSHVVQSDRMRAAEEFSRTHKVLLVLKGARTIVADEKGRLFLNPTGNPGMATAGSGDVLTGMIAGLIAQGLSPLSAAQAGVYLHGLAGDLASQDKGERGMIASDIIEKIPPALRMMLCSPKGG